MTSPRVRSLLRQANRVAESGKRTAAEELFRSLLEEAPDVADGWVGLGNVVQDKAEKEQAYARALELDPKHEEALTALAILNGEIIAEPVLADLPQAEEDFLHPHALKEREEEAEHDYASPPPDELVYADEDEVLVCYRHPDTETALRCNRCNKPICIKCANRTSVGYRCPECIREIESEFFTAKTADYLIAAAITGPLSLAVGFVATFLGGGFFFIFLAAFIGGGLGTLIARLAHRAIGRRRGRYIPRMVAGIILTGVLLPALAVFLLSFSLFTLLVPGILAATAASSGYYFLR